MNLENLKLEKLKLLKEKKALESEIKKEFNSNHTSQTYYFLQNKINIKKKELKKINNEIVKSIIVRDAFTFGSPIF